MLSDTFLDVGGSAAVCFQQTYRPTGGSIMRCIADKSECAVGIHLVSK